MRLKIYHVLALALVFSTLSCKVSTEATTTPNSEVSETNQDKPLNIILLIGDGMGLSEVSASYYYNENKPNFDRFETIGLIKTSAASHLITDSAASATAYATGVSTYNGAISVDQDTVAIKTIVEHLIPRNISTGLISTSSVVHATPASFYAHVKKRRMYDDIAAALPTSNIDFIAGGGDDFFDNRNDKRKLYNELVENGYEVHTKQLPTTVGDKKQAIILAPDGMPKMIEGRGDYLPNATKLALEKLSKNPNGFFLMVEGSQIDWGGHNNEADYLISELIDFDNTIGVALDFAKNNSNTLVIVTADHETGGFTLSADGKDYNKIKPTFSTSGHSGTLVPVFAKGPGENNFNGIFKNTELFNKMLQLFDK
ncbi:alkaline phosphatase [Patiriisocius marinus]|uniref:Alkaline phosphatase n=1 Tax=Patiriisocius marinus TaxID=1397112 RepID=A0A5J4ITE8_9FLAO|nr:alkaline phosphatase [Patiriisocius marinus]GER57924.1 alkaline phosphatase [Patiriisocius marinus]